MSSGFRLLTTPGDDISFARRNVQPPSALFVDQDEGLSISFWSSINPTSFEVRGRLLRSNGRLTQIREVVTAASGNNRQLVQTWRPLSRGWLLDLAVFPSSGIFTTRGQCFVSVGLAQGPNVGPFGTRVLCQGYLENFIALQFPGSPIQGFLDGAGFLRFVVGTTPGGFTSTETVPTGARWRLATYRIGLSTSANVGGRNLAITFTTGGGANTIVEFFAVPTQHENQITSYEIATYAPAAAGNVGGLQDWALQAAQPFYLKAGDAIVAGISMPLAGDVLSAPAYYVEEWLQP